MNGKVPGPTECQRGRPIRRKAGGWKPSIHEPREVHPGAGFLKRHALSGEFDDARVKGEELAPPVGAKQSGTAFTGRLCSASCGGVFRFC